MYRNYTNSKFPGKGSIILRNEFSIIKYKKSEILL